MAGSEPFFLAPKEGTEARAECDRIKARYRAGEITHDEAIQLVSAARFKEA